MFKFCNQITRSSTYLDNLKAFRNVVCSRKYSQPNETSIMEIMSGAGGAEAMLFADDMFNVYSRFFQHKHWPYSIDSIDRDPAGGIRTIKLLINSPESFNGLIQEAGVHRVQRVPKTEKNARMHTSTIAIAVTPQSVVDVQVKERDLDIQTKRSSGPGGQHVNKTETAIRLLHKPTGIVVECQETRSQIENRAKAVFKLREKLQQIEMDRILNSYTELKKNQILRANRNEKIRTYNFPQDRINDHRIKKSYQNLRGLFGGDMTVLEKMIKDYNEHHQTGNK